MGDNDTAQPGQIADALDATVESRGWRADSAASFRDGAFRLTKAWQYWAYAVADGSAELEAQHLSGAQAAAYGMCFRFRERDPAKGASGYMLVIAANNGWKLMKCDGRGSIADLTRWAESSEIRVGDNEWNLLKVVCEGPRIRAFVNGTEVGSVDDKSYTDAGGVGPVSLYDGQEVAFRNLAIDSASEPAVCGSQRFKTNFLTELLLILLGGK